MSQRDNYENGRGCLGVVALILAVLLVGGFALTTAVYASIEIDTPGKFYEESRN